MGGIAEGTGDGDGDGDGDGFSVSPREKGAHQKVCGKCDRAQLAVNTPLAGGGKKVNYIITFFSPFLAVRFPRLNLASEGEVLSYSFLNELCNVLLILCVLVNEH